MKGHEMKKKEEKGGEVRERIRGEKTEKRESILGADHYVITSVTGKKPNTERKGEVGDGG